MIVRGAHAPSRVRPFTAANPSSGGSDGLVPWRAGDDALVIASFSGVPGEATLPVPAQVHLRLPLANAFGVRNHFRRPPAAGASSPLIASQDAANLLQSCRKANNSGKSGWTIGRISR